MHLALWDFLVAEYLSSAAESLDVAVERQTDSRCVDLLKKQQVDISLLPVDLALSSADELDILPGSAVCSREYPLTQMVVHRELQQAVTLKAASEQRLETFMAKTILKEHYGREIQVVSEGDADLELLSQTDSVAQKNAPNTLNLTREWYEMAMYPMVWGVYCCMKGKGTVEMIKLLMAITKEAEAVTEDHRQNFPDEELRFRLDNVALAGLTAVQEYMYYYGITKDPQPPQIYIPEKMQKLPWWEQDTKT